MPGISNELNFSEIFCIFFCIRISNAHYFWRYIYVPYKDFAILQKVIIKILLIGWILIILTKFCV